jgi:N-acetylneuraminic acid mutarotase
MTVTAWKRTVVAPTGIAHQASVDYNKRLILICGLKGAVPMSLVAATRDGRNFENLIYNQTSLPARAYHAATVFDERMWISGGLNVATKLKDVRFSADGLTWTKTHDMHTAVYGHKLVSFDGLVHLGGYDGTKYYNNILASSNGVDFDTVHPGTLWKARGFFGALVFDNRLWIIGGKGLNGATAECYNDVWSTADLIHWDRSITTAPWQKRACFGCCVWDGRMWIIGGRDTEGAVQTALKDTWYSRDGMTWHKGFDFPTTVYGNTVNVIDNKIRVVGGVGNEHNVYQMNLG